MQQSTFNRLVIASAVTVAGAALYVYLDDTARTKVQGLVNRERAKAMVKDKLKGNDELIESVDDLSDDEVNLLMKFIDGSHAAMDKATDFLEDASDRAQNFKEDLMDKTEDLSKGMSKKAKKLQKKATKKSLNFKDDAADTVADVADKAHESYLDTVKQVLKVANLFAKQLDKLI